MEISTDKINLLKTIYLTLDKDKDSNLNCMESLVAYVQQISSTYPAPYTLFVSGGIDSQAMLYVWKLSGVPFTAVRVNYLGYNDHDFKECREFCEREQIEVSMIDFDVIDFLENRLSQYAGKYKCASPQICTHMAFSELITVGTKIFSGNLVLDGRIAVDNTVYGLQRYATLARQNLIPFFLMGSEDIVKSSIIAYKKLPVASEGSYQKKCELYQAIGIPIIPQLEKLTGFEAVKNYYDGFTYRVTRRMKLKHSRFPSKRVFDQLFRNKYLLSLNNHYSISLLITEK